MQHSAAVLPRAQVVALDGIGHMPQVEAPERANAAFRALAAARRAP